MGEEPVALAFINDSVESFLTVPLRSLFTPPYSEKSTNLGKHMNLFGLISEALS